MKPAIRIISIIIAIIYPFGVYFGIRHFEPRILSLFLLAIALSYLLSSSANPIAKWQKYSALAIISAVILLLQIFNDLLFIRLYPVLMSLLFFGAFAYTLFFPPSMVEKFARLKHKNIEPYVVEYTRKVTIVWCIFLSLNAAIALYTAFYTSIETWTLYNGFISYCLMGCLFVGEYIVRYFVKAGR
jgi:uncharacterized membrane protein